MGFWSTLGKGFRKVVRSPLAPIVAGALGAPLAGVAIGKAIVDHVGADRKDPTLKSIAGSGLQGASGAYAGGKLKSAAGNLGGWRSAGGQPVEFAKEFGKELTGIGKGGGGSKAGAMWDKSGLSFVPRVAADGTAAASTAAYSGMGGGGGTVWGLPPWQGRMLQVQAGSKGLEAIGEGLTAHSERNTRALNEALLQQQVDANERYKRRGEQMAAFGNPMLAWYIQQMAAGAPPTPGVNA